ncbi:Serine/threonine-protein kinase 19 [Heterocephalus glaber]|uniref:Serine/threonine-protein kinase 19 n=1 Tax=Heterocephalus glaber TaxID=10181 RepID=G5C3H5_HETGA|nr:Serine/threonine-protein kinase 19 [Heterocephalus glaber]
MSQKRHRLVPQTLGLKRRRERGPVDADALRGESGSARAAVAELVRLFPRGLFEDALPPIALRSQVYSLVPDRTAADRQVELDLLVEYLKTDAVDAWLDGERSGPVMSSRPVMADRVLGLCRGFWLRCFQPVGKISRMTQTFGFRDSEITHLVNAGVLTVRDVGSWWLAVPGAGRFIKYFVKGRQAVLGMVRKAKYREVLLSELLGRRAPAAVRLGLAYHVHDLIGAQLVDCISTTSGTVLRLPET